MEASFSALVLRIFIIHDTAGFVKEKRLCEEINKS